MTLENPRGPHPEAEQQPPEDTLENLHDQAAATLIDELNRKTFESIYRTKLGVAESMRRLRSSSRTDKAREELEKAVSTTKRTDLMQFAALGVPEDLAKRLIDKLYA